MSAGVQQQKCHCHWNEARYIILKAIVPFPCGPHSSLNKLSMVANLNDCYRTLTKEKEKLSWLLQSGTTELTISRDHIPAQK